jgi:hypothetical protein
MKDQRREELSDFVRRGIPIDFKDALAVIAYQEKLREQRNITSRSTLTGKAGAFWSKLKLHNKAD